MFRVLATFFLAFLAAGTPAHPHNSPIPSVAVATPSNCSAAEAIWQASEKCNATDCGCTNEYLRTWAAVSFCDSGPDITNVNGPAFGQYAVNTQADRCRSQGFNVDNFEIKLSPAQLSFLDGLYRKDEVIRQKQTAFFALQMAGGQVGLPLLVFISILSGRIRRDPTFFNFCITWIFSSVVFCVLLYRGTRGHTSDNPYGDEEMAFSQMCALQASLVDGVQIMTATSTMALVIQLWRSFRTAIYGTACGAYLSRLITAALLLLPYIFLIAFSVPANSIADTQVTTPSTTNIFYCTVEAGSTQVPFLRGVYGVTIALLLITVVFDSVFLFLWSMGLPYPNPEVLIVRIMYRHWWAFRHIQAKSVVPLSTLLRIIIFSVYRIIVAIAYATVMFSSQKKLGSNTNMATGVSTTLVNLVVPVWVDMLQAAIPLIAFLVLGLSRENITTLIFWRKTERLDKKTAPIENIESYSKLGAQDADIKM